LVLTLNSDLYICMYICIYIYIYTYLAPSRNRKDFSRIVLLYILFGAAIFAHVYLYGCIATWEDPQSNLSCNQGPAIIRSNKSGHIQDQVDSESAIRSTEWHNACIMNHAYNTLKYDEICKLFLTGTTPNPRTSDSRRVPKLLRPSRWVSEKSAQKGEKPIPAQLKHLPGSRFGPSMWRSLNSSSTRPAGALQSLLDFKKIAKSKCIEYIYMYLFICLFIYFIYLFFIYKKGTYRI